MTQPSDLPLLLAGQVWQCRRQEYTARIYSVAPYNGGVDQIADAKLYRTGNEGVFCNYNYISNRASAADCHYSVFSGVADGGDLTLLLYSPDWD